MRKEKRVRKVCEEDRLSLSSLSIFSFLLSSPSCNCCVVMFVILLCSCCSGVGFEEKAEWELVVGKWVWSCMKEVVAVSRAVRKMVKEVGVSRRRGRERGGEKKEGEWVSWAGWCRNKKERKRKKERGGGGR